VQDGKQGGRALVPTTLLSHQHLQTFRERMAQFPVEVRELSRFTAPSDVEATIDGIADGKADIVIGPTESCSRPSGSRIWLVVVDEEQRFGVEHKSTQVPAHRRRRADHVGRRPSRGRWRCSLTGIAR